MAALPLWVRADEQTSQPLHNESILQRGEMLNGECYGPYYTLLQAEFQLFKL
jgi:hypothetical protein